MSTSVFFLISSLFTLAYQIAGVIGLINQPDTRLKAQGMIQYD
ncbi:MAG: hypothetical protein NZ772_05260 [Cyanobacteria bacterium]|nr:hypothetical protein [Cyanobacteriota bacterium]MDW8200005.1 hypothetical protein [Cyanobacteriota bacterium SKYGB_h_bin112]